MYEPEKIDIVDCLWNHSRRVDESGIDLTLSIK